MLQPSKVVDSAGETTSVGWIRTDLFPRTLVRFAVI